MEPTSLRNSAPPGRRAAFFGYVGGVILAAVVVVIPSAILSDTALLALPGTYWLMLTLACAGDARPFTATGPRQSVAVFPSICFAFAALLMWGLPAAVLIQASATMFFSWRMRHSLWRA